MANFFKSLFGHIKKIEHLLNEYLNRSEGSAQLPYLAYVNWGISLSQAENLDEALEKLETSAQMNPNSPVVQLNLGQVYMKKGLYEEAIRRFKKTIRLDNSNGFAYSLVAACLIMQDEFKDAETFYKKAVSISPNNPEILVNYATALARRGKRFKALDIYREALKISSTNFDALHCSGVLLCELGKYEEALEQLLAADAVTPNCAETLLYLSICKYYLEDYEKSYEYVNKSLEIKSDSPDAKMIQGACLAKLGKEAECLSCFSANAKESEGHPRYFTFWAIALQTFGRYAEAKEKFLQAFELNRDDEYNLYFFAENYLKEGNSTPALQLFQKIVEINPRNAAAYEKIGNIMYQKAKYKEAIDAYMNAIKVSRKHNHLYCDIAKCYYDAGDLKNSENYYVKAIDYNPDLIDAYIGYANLMMQIGNNKEALRKIRTAHKKAPESFDVYVVYSRALIKMEMYKDAIEKLDKILEMEPEYYDAVFTKAEVLNELNKPQEAIGLLQMLPEELHDTRDFLSISMTSYNNLAQLSPSHYNISKAIEYCDRLTDKYSSEYKLSDVRHRLEETLKTIKGE